MGQILKQYETMVSCSMEAVVRCEYEHESREYTLGCTYNVDGESEVTILKPEALQGLTIIFEGEERRVTYKDLVLDAPALGKNGLSPADVLPRLMDAVKQGWLLEENEENWGEVPCIRLSVDESAADGRKIVSTMWLRREDGTPLRGEVALDGERILTAEFTAFAFYDKINQVLHYLKKILPYLLLC